MSSDYPRKGERWCDSKRMEVSVISPCYFATVEDMIHARDWYADLARRLTKAIAMREAEERG